MKTQTKRYLGNNNDQISKKGSRNNCLGSTLQLTDSTEQKRNNIDIYAVHVASPR